MRGADTFTESLFSMRKLDDFVPKSHPLRSIRVMANEALAKMDRQFAQMYEADIKGGRPSIAPEKLLRAMLIQVLFSIRSERQLMEQVQYNLLFRWFIGLAMDDEVWVPTVFTKNRERLIKHDAVIEFFNEVVSIAGKKCLLSGEHFSVDGTLIQAWAGHKSFVRKNGDDQDNDGGGAGDFKGEKRSNETHQSKTDPDAQLYRKGKTASELRYMGHTLVTPHVAQNTSGRRSAVPDAIASSVGYAISQQKRKLIEQGFGWAKTVGRMRQVMVRGLKKVDQMFVLNMAAYNLVRMRSLAQVRP
ncbi:IS5 family transposase [Paraburkholderia guartelaensis]|uniref:IS5 family transposase n=4 Tax=Paraburkholderia guartelaensis TaxID=2546446 RepID=A0A4R5KAB5_9BURK|nr:IS5 family transposase [Paraburkholderia guartelaensis]TDF91966.1 IS5 family transposase [Paraburkholderia guartelaensis]